MTQLLDHRRWTDGFTEQGLTSHIGEPGHWDYVIFKELVDNAVDAVTGSHEKLVTISYGRDFLRITNSGAGLTPENLYKIYDFNRTVSSKHLRRTISRGKLGSALKQIIGVCFVKNYELTFHVAGSRYTRRLDSACLTTDSARPVFILETSPSDIQCSAVEISGINLDAALIGNACLTYRIVNPDVTFIVNDTEFAAIAAPSEPPKGEFISWYDAAAFERYARACVRADPDLKTLAFIKSFAGMSAARLPKDLEKKLQALVVDSAQISALFGTLNASSKRVSVPKQLHLKPETLAESFGVGTDALRFEEISGFKQDIPYRIETALVVNSDPTAPNRCIFAVNHSVPYDSEGSELFSRGFYSPFPQKDASSYMGLRGFLRSLKFLDGHGLTFVFSLTSPVHTFEDQKKASIRLSRDEIKSVPVVLGRLFKHYNSAFKRCRLTLDGFTPGDAIHQRHKRTGARPISRQKLLTELFHEGYALASSDGRYTTTARQVFYAIRSLGLTRYGVDLNKSYNLFTQKILTSEFANAPALVDRIFLEVRGNLTRPYGSDTPLGTKYVRGFNQSVNRTNHTGLAQTFSSNVSADVPDRLKYNKILVVEKQGFKDLLERELDPRSRGLAIASCQGFANRALKQMLQTMVAHKIKVFVLHDCDPSGYLIAHRLAAGSETFAGKIPVTNIGLTVDDVRRLGKDHLVERVKSKKRAFAQTSEFLKTLNREERKFFGADLHKREFNRVELNSLTSAELIQLITDRIDDDRPMPTKEELGHFIRFNAGAVASTLANELLTDVIRPPGQR